MIIKNSYISKGGSEVTLECEFREKYIITLADARRHGLVGLSEEDFPIEFSDDELIVFLSQKLRAIKYATYLLQFSDKSEKVLRRKMHEKEYGDSIIDEALRVLREGGIIDDENLALRKYISIANSKLYGPHRIKSELFAKGFTAEDIRNAEENANIDFEELLRHMCNKLLLGGRVNLSDKDEREKFKAKLSRYGYGFDCISKVLREFQADLFED